jgi:hypothetical protein
VKLRRLTCHDLVVDGDQSAAYVGDSVVVLSPISTTVLTALAEDRWESVTDVAALVEETYGNPPEGSAFEAVSGVVDELARLGLVERVD